MLQSRYPMLRRGFGSALLLLFVVLASPRADAAKSAIASAHPLATSAGMEILAQGGNAFDAAVAVAAALAVVEPYASGLGGGGFFLLHRATDGFQTLVDARETAPRRATRDMYVDADGKVDARRSLDGGLAAGIPGTPAGLVWIAERYGRLPFSAALKPAVKLAREGFAVDARYAQAVGWRADLLARDASAAAIFLDAGQAPAVGFVVRQPALAEVMQRLGAHGRDGFYAGAVAARLVSGVQARGGIWDLADLAEYQVVERAPIIITYRGARVVAASLPSSGGLVLAEVLHILARYPLSTLPRPQRDHLVAEALRRGYQDRARYMGDPAFVKVPSALSTGAYADERAASIEPDKATPSALLDQLYPPFAEGDNTTHFSIADAEGNRVAATLSINLPFGAGVVAGDTGVLLNNEMNDFSLAANVPNAYSLVGDAANAVQAGKRPLSSMTPTFVEDERGTLILGTPGGSRIISMVALAILDYVHSGAVDIEQVVGAPRFHQQYLPDRIEYEPNGFGAEWTAALRELGHEVQEGRRRWGNMQAVFVDRATGDAAAYNDPRGKSGVLF